MAAAAQLLPASGDLAAWRDALRQQRRALIDSFLGQRATVAAAARLTKALTRLADDTLLRYFAEQGPQGEAALVAVGGYGRGELFPHSDVDLLLLLPGEPTEAQRTRIEAFVGGCFDLGLDIGWSVRTPAQCAADAQGDITIQTALLEARWLTGSRRLFALFQQATAAVLEPQAFLRAKTLELRQRHVKFDDTPYALEPNCKESPGGLRDLQTVLWVARAAGLGRSWSELATRGLLTAFEVSQLKKHEGTLKLIRARLHALAGRREDRLVFDLQTAVAESFGLAGNKALRASERLMHRYYWAAKAVTQLREVLLLNIEERLAGTEGAPMQPLNERFLDRGGLIEVARDDLYLKQPQAILETFELFQTRPGMKGLSARTLRALYNARQRMDSAFRRDPVNRARFMAILQHPSGQTHVFRLLNQTSVLGRYLWVFRRIVGRMQHDLFHVYTVDQHILMVLRNVRRFFIPEHAHEYPFCSQLAAQFDRPWVLYLAALFHDIAKGRGGDHSDLGGGEVRRFCRDHRVGRDDALLIEFLVREHLTMSRIAQKEDLADPLVIHKFAALVASPQRLAALYLLTVADIRGTSPKVWNAWKGKLLEDLYRITLRTLGGAAPNPEAEIEARKQEARQVLALHSALPGGEEPLWRTLDLSYFARHDATDIAWHARTLWRHVDGDSAVVSARPAPHGEGLQVLVYTPDQEDLFARICGYFDRAGFSIQDAKVHTSRSRYALDTFQVVHPAYEDDPTGYRDLISLVEAQLAQALNRREPLPEPKPRGRLSRQARSFPQPPRVTLRPDERAQRWLLSVTTLDRAGLLYAIARVLARHHVNLHLAKVSTLGERVEDTFLVDGPALQHNRLQLQIETELLEAADPLKAEV